MNLNFVLVLVFLIIGFSYSIGETYDVIVIGGGVSGLAACKRLIDNGITNILLIEAANRLGGRINTIQFENVTLEIGAQFIHGVNGNPIYKIMDSLGQIDNSYEFFNDGTIYQATQNGQPQNEKYVDKVTTVLEDIFDGLINNGAGKVNIYNNVGQIIDNKFNNALKSLEKQPGYNLELVKSIKKSFLDDLRSDYAIDSFYELSAKAFENYEEFSGEEYNNLKNGFIKLIEYLKSYITDSNSIKYNEYVENIDWSDIKTSDSDGVFKIRTVNSLTKVKSFYESKFVVSSVSLGFLKSNHRTLFTPKLPIDKINAINKLGFGTVNKIFLFFDSPVFADQEAGLQLLWRNDLNFTLDVENKCNLKGNKFYKSFDSFLALPKKSNILFTFLNGNDGAFSEKVSDECMIDVLSELFTKFFPDLDLPRPRKIIRSKWNSNPLTKGSYSFFKVGSSLNDLNNLARPVNNKMFIIGEATSRYSASVHGAFMTGQAAANKITKLL